jgi:hypothetical protein
LKLDATPRSAPVERGKIGDGKGDGCLLERRGPKRGATSVENDEVKRASARKRKARESEFCGFARFF